MCNKINMTKKQKKYIIQISISAVLLLAAYLITHFLDDKLDWWMQLLIFVPGFVVIAYDVVIGAAKQIGHGQFLDEKFLMTIASIGAFCVQEYPEAVGVMIFYKLGELLENIAVGKSRKSIENLIKICPNEATVIRNGEELVVNPSEVSIGEYILIKPGEKVPVDCIIEEGTTTVDTVALTGESMPQDKFVGDTLLSGSVNLNGVVKCKTTTSYESSTAYKIIELIQNASDRKAKSENFISRFAKYYTPIVVALALLVAIIPPLCINMSNWDIWQSWIYKALMFLVVSCPCALLISVPLTFFNAIGAGSKRGILIKGSNHIETLSKVNTIYFDKTGTLTQGVFKVVKIESEKNKPEELLEIAAYIESHSNHPIAESIRKEYKSDIDFSRVSEIQEVIGYGIECKIDGKYYVAGNYKLMDQKGIDYKKSEDVGTIIYVSSEKEYLGYIVISDVVKNNAKETISNLKELGVQNLGMLTGDTVGVAEKIKEELELTVCEAQLLPGDKARIVSESKNKKGKVCFVGDGINDAPVLVEADVGIAMGAMGSDAAIEAADVVLMDDNINKIKDSIHLSKKTMKIVYENIIFSIGVKVIIMILALFNIANMWIAVFGDVGVLILAVLNSLRTMRIKK